MFNVCANVWGLWCYDNGPIDASLFLEAGVGVVPVGAVLTNGEFVGKGCAGSNGRKADIGDPIHLRRDQEAVPVDGGLYVHFIVDMDSGQVTFLEKKGGTGDGFIHGHGSNWFSGKIDLFLFYAQVILNGGGQENREGMKQGKEKKEG